MRKFKCIESEFSNVTVGKVYDVIKYIERESYTDIILIKNDSGYELRYIVNTLGGRKLFEDVTTECRGEIIDEILS